MSNEETTETALARRIKAALRFAIVPLALWLGWEMAKGISWSDLQSRLREADPTLVGFAAFCLAFRFVPWAHRWRLALRRIDRPSSLLLGLSSLIAALAVNFVTPTIRIFGGFLRARHLHRGSRHSFGQLYGVVLYDQTMHAIVMGLLAWISVIVVATEIGRPGVGAVATLLLAALGAVFFYWESRRDRTRGSWLRRFVRKQADRSWGRFQFLADHGREAADVMLNLLKDRYLWLPSFVLSTLIFVLQAISQWLVFRALGSEVGLAGVAAVVALGSTAGIFTGTPGGVATTEAAMIALYATIGVDRLAAVAATVLYRSLYYGVIFGLGIPSLIVLEHRTLRDRVKIVARRSEK